MLSYILIRHSLFVFYLEGRIDFGVGVESEFDKHCYHYYEFFLSFSLKNDLPFGKKDCAAGKVFLNLRRF